MTFPFLLGSGFGFPVKEIQSVGQIRHIDYKRYIFPDQNIESLEIVQAF